MSGKSYALLDLWISNRRPSRQVESFFFIDTPYPFIFKCAVVLLNVAIFSLFQEDRKKLSSYLRRFLLFMLSFFYALQFHVPFAVPEDCDFFNQTDLPLREWPSAAIYHLGEGPRELNLIGSSTRRESTYFAFESNGLVKTGRICFLRRPAIQNLGFLERYKSWLRREAETSLGLEAKWILAMVLGEKRGIPQEEKQIFIETGTVHLLVVSGLHVGIVGILFSFIIFLPIRFLYYIRALQPSTYTFLYLLHLIFAALLVLSFAWLTGFSISTQRAALLFLGHILFKIFWPSIIFRNRVFIILFIQTLLLPEGFVCDGMILSWGSYLLVAANGQRKYSTLGQCLFQLLCLQLSLCILVTGITGQASLSGIFINPPLILMFSVLLPLCALQVFILGPLDLFPLASLYILKALSGFRRFLLRAMKPSGN